MILLDIRLPDGSGFDFCRQMRQLGIKQPIIMLTAQHDEMDKVLGLEMGADDYVTKPFSLRELISRVRAQLRRAYGDYASADSDSVLVSDLMLEQTTGQVRRRGFCYRIDSHRISFSESSCASSWAGVIPHSNCGSCVELCSRPRKPEMVNMHIRRLREKIELEPEEPAIILTVPGIGYRLVG